MTVRFVNRPSTLVACLGLTALVLVAWEYAVRTAAAEEPAPAPSHQVIAAYFHRTVRCPTCRRISAYIEEAIQTGFEAEVKDGSVKMVMIDFQNAKNQKYTQAYQISGPTLVLMDVRDGKVTSWRPAPKVWSLVGNKGEFFKYVQGGVREYLDGEKKPGQ